MSISLIFALKRYVSFLLLIFIVFSFDSLVLAAEKDKTSPGIATIVNFTGSVKVRHNGLWNTLTTSNLELFTNDKVITEEGAVKVVFKDDAVLEIGNNSNLRIEQEMKKAIFSSQEKIMERKIRLLLGKINYESGKNKKKKGKIETTLESPFAVAVLKETIVSFGVSSKGTYGLIKDGKWSTVGDVINNVPPDVTKSEAMFSSVQRAALDAAAIGDLAARAASESVATGNINDIAKAVEAKAESVLNLIKEGLSEAQSMSYNPVPEVRFSAERVVERAEAAIRQAKVAVKLGNEAVKAATAKVSNIKIAKVMAKASTLLAENAKKNFFSYCVEGPESGNVTQSIATVVDFTGSVKVRRNGRWSSLIVCNLTLFADDKIVTENGTVKVVFKDGAVLKAGNNSNLHIKQKMTEKDGTFSIKKITERRTRLLLGRIAYESSKKKKKKKKIKGVKIKEEKKTTIESPTAVVALRGTKVTFGVNSEEEFCTLIDGKWSIFGDCINKAPPAVTNFEAMASPLQLAALNAAALGDVAAYEYAKSAETNHRHFKDLSKAAQTKAKAVLAAAEEGLGEAQSMSKNPVPAVSSSAKKEAEKASSAIRQAKVAVKLGNEAVKAAKAGDKKTAKKKARESIKQAENAKESFIEIVAGIEIISKQKDTDDNCVDKEEEFIDVGDGTAVDKLSGLMWTKDANLPGKAMDWYEAKDYIAEMNRGVRPNFGYTDWNLPSLDDLRDFIKLEVVDDSKFPGWQLPGCISNVQPSYYWSSYSYTDKIIDGARDPANSVAWALDMWDGNIKFHRKNKLLYVWPVR